MLSIATGFLVTILISLNIQTELAFSITESKALTYTIFIPLGFLFMISILQKSHAEPAVKSILILIRKTFSLKSRFILSVSASMAIAGFITDSNYAFGISGLTLILGITFLYFYYCTNVIVNKIDLVS